MARRRIWIAALLLAACAGGGSAPAALRVGTSGDYAPFSTVAPDGARAGYDVELVRAYARERGLRIRWVPLRWATLERDFAAGRFDLVASGVTVRPERSLAGRFTVPVATSGAVALASESVDIGRAGLRIAVNRGGHLERVARRLFPKAQLLPLAPNAAVREALIAGEADAAVTDTMEAPHWLAGTSGLAVRGPFTRDWKALWLPAGAGERARDLDAWLLAREADGTLAALRARQLPAASAATATPLVALAAAIEERLALMPLVAEAKRASGTPVRVPAQEAAVIAAAPERARPLFAALIEAAREVQEHALAEVQEHALAGTEEHALAEVQEHALAGEPAAGAPPDLDDALRPALARIGERIAALAERLPAGLDAATAREALARIEVPGFGAVARERVAAALVEVAGERGN
jgi:cyclohexadienyl dehydratase